MATTGEVIEAYLKLKGVKDALKKKHQVEMAPINDQLNTCAMWIHKQLQEQGITSFRAADGKGTAYLSVETAVTVQDWDAIMAWITETNSWPMLEKRVSAAVVKDYIESHKEIPPGLKVTAETVVHIRKS